MANANYSIESFDEMKRKAQDIRDHAEQYEEIQKQITTVVENLHAAWEGSDNLDFVRKFKEFATHLHNMAAQLENDASTLEAQTNNYIGAQNDALDATNNLPQ